MSAAQTKKKNSQIRHQRIYKRFIELYEVQFIRKEKAIEKIADEVFLSERTVKDIVSKMKRAAC